LDGRDRLREDLLLHRALDELGEVALLQPALREQRAQGHVGVFRDFHCPANGFLGLGHD
jgi:hypothetical protein